MDIKFNFLFLALLVEILAFSKVYILFDITQF